MTVSTPKNAQAQGRHSAIFLDLFTNALVALVGRSYEKREKRFSNTSTELKKGKDYEPTRRSKNIIN